MWSIIHKKNMCDVKLLMNTWRELRDVCSESEYQHVLFCVLLGQEKRTGKNFAIRQSWKLEMPEQAKRQNIYPSFVSSFFLSFGLGKVLCKKAKELLRMRHFDAAQSIDLSLLLAGYLRPSILFRRAKAAFLRFHFSSAFHLCALIRACFPHWRPGFVALFQGQCAQLCNRPEEALVLYAQAFLEHGLTVEVAAPAYEASLRHKMGNFAWQKVFALAQAEILRLPPISRAQSLILAGEPQAAEKILHKLPLWQRQSALYAVTKARSFLFQGKKDEAKCILERLLRKKKTCIPAYNEAMRLCCFTGDKEWAKKIWKAVAQYNLSVTPVLEWQLLCGLGRLPEAFLRHGRARYFHALDPYLEDRLLPGLPPKEGKRLNTFFILSECFSGDEFRFARLYPLMAKKANADKVIFSCDPRMLAILQRSFPQLEFVPVQRVQSVIELKHYDDFNQLPDIDCCRYLDNNGWKFAKTVDGVTTVMHALADTLEGYEQLKTLPRLIINPKREADFKAFLSSYRPKKLVGLSWRSMQNRFDRNWGSFNLDELEPLLHMDGVQFINCQYDGCTTEEREFLDSRFPGKVLDIPELDQKEDIDGAAALYSCLDAMLTAPTYTCEVAGGIGIPTVIFAGARVPELFTFPGTNHHAFFGSNSHILCAFGNERIELPNKIRQKLIVLLNSSSEK